MIDSIFMKYLRKFGAVTISLLYVLCACSDDFMQDSITDAVLPMSDITVDPLGDRLQVAYTSGTKWQCVVGPDSWVSFSDNSDAMSGDPGTTIITLEIKPNLTEHDRELTLKFIKCDKYGEMLATDSDGGSFKISQNYAYLNLEGDVFMKDQEWQVVTGWHKEEMPKQISVKSNIKWIPRFAGNGEKITVSDIEHKLDGDHMLNVEFKDNNLSLNPYLATVTLTPYKEKVNGDVETLPTEVVEALEKKIAIIHENLVFLVEGKAEDYTLPAFSELGQEWMVDSQMQTLTIKSEEEWELEEYPDWVNCSQDPTGNETVGEKELAVTLLSLNVHEANPDSTDRNGLVVLQSVRDNRAKRIINVKQSGYKLEGRLYRDDYEVKYMPVDTSGTAQLKIETNGPWKIIAWPEWMSIPEDGLSGTGNAEISVTSTVWNLSQDELPGNILIVPENSNGARPNNLERIVDVRKAPFIFRMGENVVNNKMVKDILSQLPMKNTSTYKLYVETSGPWDLLPIEYVAPENGTSDWFEVSETSGEESKYIDVRALSVNPDKDNDRTAKMTFVSRLHQQMGQSLSIDVPVTQEKLIFEIGESSLRVPAYKKNGIQKQLEFKCSYDWTLTAPDWIYVTSDPQGLNPMYSGDGLDYPTLYMNIETNTSKNENPGRIAITNHYDNEVKYIDVTQDGFVFDVNMPSVPSLLSYKNAGTYTIGVTTTDEAEWEVIPEEEYDWIEKTKDASSLVLTVLDNRTQKERTGKFAIKSNVSGETKPLTLKQENYLFNVPDKTFSNFDELASNSQTQCFNVECKDSWEIINSHDWLLVEPKSESGNQEVSVKVINNNLGDSERSATITVKDHFGGYSKNLTFKQNGFIFNLTDNSVIQLNDNNATTKKVTLKSSDEWTASSDKDWITLDPSSGEASKTSGADINLKIEKNLINEVRTAKLTFKSKYYSDDNPLTNLINTITVIQPEYQFSVAERDSIEVSAAGIEQNVDVICSGSWKVESDKSWCNVGIGTRAAVEATGNGTIVLKIDPNRSDGKTPSEERKAIVTISTTDGSKFSDGSSLSKRITVIQFGEQPPANN